MIFNFMIHLSHKLSTPNAVSIISTTSLKPSRILRTNLDINCKISLKQMRKNTIFIPNIQRGVDKQFSLNPQSGFILHAFAIHSTKNFWIPYYCSYLSTKTYVVGIQKNRLDETVL